MKKSVDFSPPGPVLAVVTTPSPSTSPPPPPPPAAVFPRAMLLSLNFLNLAGGTCIQEEDARGAGAMRLRRKRLARIEAGMGSEAAAARAARAKARAETVRLEPVEEQLAAMAKLHREGFLSSEEFDDVAE